MKNFIATNIKRLCFVNRIDILELGKRTGIPQSTLDNLGASTKGDLNSKVLKSIADYFDVSTCQLLGKRHFNQIGSVQR